MQTKSPSENAIEKAFGNQLRIRVSGVLVHRDKVLLIKHKHIGNREFFWSPPGGGMQYGEDVISALKREFKEEVHLDIEVKKLICVHEYLESPLHAIELFFEVKTNEIQHLQKGTDPEMQAHEQIILDVQWFTCTELAQINNKHLHRIFHNITSYEELLQNSGYLIS